MKQLMEELGVDIPKWEGPTVCESSLATSESTTDVKPLRAKEKVKNDLIKKERKRKALTDDGSVKEETASAKRERADSPVEIKEEK